MNLVIDIGNTQTKLAWFDKGRMADLVRLNEDETQHFERIFRKEPVENAIISSVGKQEEVLTNILKANGVTPFMLDHQTPLPIQISYKTPETLGRDRIAAAAGAHYVCPYCNVMVVDMGTAITIEFVTAEGLYIGGNISPGLHTRFKALHDFTARLPLVSKNPEFPEFGDDTNSAISAGVQQGIIFEINGYIDMFTQRYPACEFIITGGDAEFFVSKLKKSIFAIPDLVLKGLNYILEYNISGQKP